MSSDNYNIAAEADLKPSVNRHIWGYFIILAVMLMATIGGLIIMYRFELLKEQELKIGDVILPQAQERKILSEALLSGKKGLFPDKSHVAIDVAIANFLQDVRH